MYAWAHVCMHFFRSVCVSEAPLWVWTATSSCGDKTQSSCKIFHSSLSFWASGQPHYHACMYQMSHLLRLPDLQDRHTSNDRVGIFLGGRVYRVIGTNHQGQVRFWLDTWQKTCLNPFFLMFFSIYLFQPLTPSASATFILNFSVFLNDVICFPPHPIFSNQLKSSCCFTAGVTFGSWCHFIDFALKHNHKCVMVLWRLSQLILLHTCA